MPGITDQIRSSATLYSTNTVSSISSGIYDAFIYSEMLASSFSDYTYETRDHLRSRIRELEEENRVLKNIIIEHEL